MDLILTQNGDLMLRKQSLIERRCESKIAYPNRYNAVRHAKNLQNLGGNTEGGTNVTTVISTMSVGLTEKN